MYNWHVGGNPRGDCTRNGRKRESGKLDETVFNRLAFIVIVFLF